MHKIYKFISPYFPIHWSLKNLLHNKLKGSNYIYFQLKFLIFNLSSAVYHFKLIQKSIYLNNIIYWNIACSEVPCIDNYFNILKFVIQKYIMQYTKNTLFLSLEINSIIFTVVLELFLLIKINKIFKINQWSSFDKISTKVYSSVFRRNFLFFFLKIMDLALSCSSYKIGKFVKNNLLEFT